MIYLIRYWKPLAVILALLVVYGAGYRHASKDADEERKTALLYAAQSNLKLNEEASHEYQQHLSALTKRYDAMRLRTTYRLRLPDTTTGLNGATVTGEFSRGVGESVTSLMYQADKNTEQLIGLQNWIKSVTK